MDTLVSVYPFILSAMGPLIVLGLILWLAGWLPGDRRITSISLPFGLGSFTYETSHEDRQILWQLYVQLKTRKAAIPFDPENDSIIEVLDSLYELVGINRELLMRLPINSSGHGSIAELILRVLNDGLRPFLTRWQSDYRHWWESEARDVTDAKTRLQTIQKSYPQYECLEKDLIEMNLQLDVYSGQLLDLAKSTRRRWFQGKRPKSIAPPGE